jgi:hypothetical protein
MHASGVASTAAASSSSPESRQCKHCGDTVVGDHEARRLHRLSCVAAPQRASSALAAVTSHTTNTNKNNLPAAVRGVNLTMLSHREQLELLATVVCRFCGLPHDVSECMERLPHGYRERLKCNAADQLTRGQISFSQRKCVTPDLVGFDRKMDKLVKKLVPMTPVINAIVKEKEVTRWRRCTHCRKRVVAKFFVQHVTHSCTVQQILRRVLALEILLTGEGGGGIRSDESSTQHSTNTSEQDQQRSLEHRLAMELLQDSSSPILTPLPTSVRRQEQIALLVGSINAVVPISDLVAPDDGDGNAMSETLVRDVLPRIRSRVEDWAAQVRMDESDGGRSISSIVHAPPLLLLSGAASPSPAPKGSGASLHASPTAGTKASKLPATSAKKHATAHTQPHYVKPEYSPETEAIARQLNNGDIVSLDDQRQQREFFAKRAAGSTGSSPSRGGSASSSHHQHQHQTSHSRPASAAESGVVALPPLVPRKDAVHEPALD